MNTCSECKWYDELMCRRFPQWVDVWHDHYCGEFARPKKKFIPPTVDEVIEYGKEIGYKIDAAYFVNHYESQEPPWTKPGARNTRIPVTNWKMTVQTWRKRANPDELIVNNGIDIRSL